MPANSPPRLVIGLTGGIASGKSTVGRLFAELGVPVLDSDVAARDVVLPGTAGLAAVADAFGPEVIGTDGALDRRALRERIFDSPDARQRLDALLHPLIRAELRRGLAQLRAPYAILEVPLLFEAGFDNEVQRSLVVDAPEALQIERVMARDGSSEAQARAILASQMARAERLARADDVIRNDGEPLQPQVERLHQLYLDLANA